MRLRYWGLTATIMFSAACALSAACGTKKDSSFEPSGDASADISQLIPEGGFGEAGDGPTRFTCSSDLQSVVDGAGRIVDACAAEQGCRDGACVPACDAASAAKGSIGCDFLVSTPPFHGSTLPPCLAVFVANNWKKPVQISVERDGLNFDVTSFGRIPDGTPDVSRWPRVAATGVPAESVAVLFLSSDPTSRHSSGNYTRCPAGVVPAVNAATTPGPSAIGKGFRIKTDVPITAYDMLPFGGARSFLPSAQLLFPTTAWGTNHVTAVPPPFVLAANPNWGQIVATEDGTSIQIAPTADLTGGTAVPNAPQGRVTNYTLNAGEFLEWTTPKDFSGSVISSTKPTFFQGGSTYLCLASSTNSGDGACDSSHQGVPPVSALGSEYVGAPYETRLRDFSPEAVLYRIVGVVNNTDLTFDPPVTGAPSRINQGDVAQFESKVPFLVKSRGNTNPFYMGQMMSGGCSLRGGARPGKEPDGGFAGDCLGDEEHIVVLPPAQFLSKYVFFTDPTYATTNLALTRTKTASGFRDVKVDCLGIVSGWKPVGTTGLYETTTVDLMRARDPVGNCVSGGHVASSDGPFGLVVWGIDSAASYGYPAGGYIAPINNVIVPVTPR